MKLQNLLICSLTFFSIVAYGKDYIKYSTIGNVKSQGIAIDLKYPSDWYVGDSDKPHTVSRLVKDYSNHKAIFLIQMVSVPQSMTSQMRSMSLAEHTKSLANVGKVNSDIKIRVADISGYKGDVVMREGVGDSASVLRVNIVNVLAKDKWLGFWCGVTTNSKTTLKDLDAIFKQSESDCNQMINSIAIN